MVLVARFFFLTISLLSADCLAAQPWHFAGRTLDPLLEVSALGSGVCLPPVPVTGEEYHCVVFSYAYYIFKDGTVVSSASVAADVSATGITQLAVPSLG